MAHLPFISFWFFSVNGLSSLIIAEITHHRKVHGHSHRSLRPKTIMKSPDSTDEELPGGTIELLNRFKSVR
jgi:hypothetical protein